MSKRRYTSAQLKERKKRKKKIITILIVILVVSIISLIAYYSHHERININQIVISENRHINDDLVIEDVNSILSGNYLLVFSKSNFLIFPRTEVKKYLDNLPAVSDVKVKVSNLNTLNIEVVEYEEVLRWCGESYLNPTDCFLVNDKGDIFARDLVSEVPRIYGVIDQEDVIGKKILDIDEFDNLMQLIKGLDTEIDFIDTEDSETFALHTTAGPYILVTLDNSPEEIISNLRTVRDTEEINDVQLGNLEYIDLRFGNRVYYQIR